MSVAPRFRADVGAHFDPALADPLVTIREDALAIHVELRDGVPPDASKDATAA